MDKRSVLLVSDDVQESDFIHSVLEDERITVIRVSTGREALDALMGVENVPAFGRINPDVMIIRNALPDMTAFEVYNVLSNYFRFSHIEYYLVSDFNDHVFVPQYSSSIFESQLDRPITADSMAYRQLLDLKRKLLNNRRAMLIPLLGMLKAKALSPFTKTGVAGAIKAAACIAGVAFSAIALTSMQSDERTSLNDVKMPEGVSYVSSESGAGSVQWQQPVAEEKTPEASVPVQEVQQEEVVVTTAAVETETVASPAEEQLSEDSVRTKKVYSIGVR